MKIDKKGELDSMYQDNYGRLYQGPYKFRNNEIRLYAPELTGVYQLLRIAGNIAETVYIGVSGVSIRQRLNAHLHHRGNVHIAQGSLDNLYFIFYQCDILTAKQIESHTILEKKPPFNVKPEYKHYLQSIAVH